MSELDQIVEILELNEQPATYGAVGGVVGVHHKVVMSGRPRNPRNSWVINKRTRVPTDYEPVEIHPALSRAVREKPIIETPEDLDDWLADHAELGPSKGVDPMKTVLKGKLVASKAYDSAEPVKLRFELTNTGGVDLYVLKWYTPLEGLNSDCLKVIRNAKNKVEYDGPMVKRGNPGPKDYLLVPAGETVSADVNVSESYAVSLPADYRVDLNIMGLEHLPAPEAGRSGAAAALSKSSPAVQELTGGGATFKVNKGEMQVPTRGKTARKTSKALAKTDEGSDPKPRGRAAAAAALPPTLIGGTAEQKAQVLKAHDDGLKLCEAALGALANDARYREWFGAHTATRFKKVTAVYTKVRDRIKSVVFTYDLGGGRCQSGWFAYTHKGDSTIWLCGSFWTAPATGTDSKAGTVVHEHTHSDANTDDVTYGQTNARALAASKPDQAVKNADSYEYYAGG